MAWDAICAVLAALVLWLLDDSPRRRQERLLRDEARLSERFDVALLRGDVGAVSSMLAGRVRTLERAARLDRG